MTPDDGIELVGKWPSDKSVPKKLAKGVKESSGENRRKLRSLVEALYAGAQAESDIALIEKYFR